MATLGKNYRELGSSHIELSADLSYDSRIELQVHKFERDETHINVSLTISVNGGVHSSNIEFSVFAEDAHKLMEMGQLLILAAVELRK